MLSQEDENITFTLPANKTVLSFLQLKMIDKIKSMDMGMIMLQQGNHKLQCWNNEEWNSKLDRENEKHKGEINKYKKELEKCKQQLNDINDKYKSELTESKSQIVKQIQSEHEYTINRLRSEGERMSKEITTLQEQKNSAFQMAFKDYDEKLTKKEEIWESKLIKLREDYETKLSEEQKERQKLLLRGQNSTIIGQDGENFTLHELTRMFPKAEIEDTHKERGRGDFIFKEKECSMLVETKNYKSNVTKPEIEKFYRDIDINNDINCGVIISLKSGICARDDFQLEVRGGKPILFLHNISGNITNLGLAVKLFKLILKPGTIDLTCKETTDKITNIIPIIKRNMNLMKQKLQKFNTEMLECTNAQESLLKELIAVLGSSY
jgi:hypothetical protein